MCWGTDEEEEQLPNPQEGLEAAAVCPEGFEDTCDDS